MQHKHNSGPALYTERAETPPLSLHIHLPQISRAATCLCISLVSSLAPLWSPEGHVHTTSSPEAPFSTELVLKSSIRGKPREDAHIPQIHQPERFCAHICDYHLLLCGHFLTVPDTPSLTRGCPPQSVFSLRDRSHCVAQAYSPLS